jgi:hypothetical protein
MLSAFRDIKWIDVKYTIPVVPTRIYKYTEGDLTLYGFGNLVSIAQNDHNTTPLDSDSVIVGIDGTTFISRQSFLQIMHSYDLVPQFNGSAPMTRYANVLYVEKNENPLVMRHVLLPYKSTASYGIQWTETRNRVELMKDGQSESQLERYVTIFAIGATIIGAAKALGLDEQFFNTCMSVPGNIEINGNCMRDPNYDLTHRHQ